MNCVAMISAQARTCVTVAGLFFSGLSSYRLCCRAYQNFLTVMKQLIVRANSAHEQ